MLLMEQHLFKKVTGRRNYQWAQVNLHVDPVHGEFVTHEYKGRSMSTLKQITRCTDRFERLARSGVFCKLERLERNGFINQDRIIENMLDVPFSNFTPVPLTYINANELRESKDAKEHLMVPIPMGRHCMIRIGYTTAGSIEAMLDDGSILSLPPAVEAGLLKLVKLGEVETIVLEAFVTQKWCQLVDLACVNGMLNNQSYKRRMNKLKRYLPDERLYGEMLKVHDVDTCRLTDSSAKPKKYLIKKKQPGFIDILENGSCAVGQFYVLPVKLISKNKHDYVNRGQGYTYGLNFYNEDYRLVERGEVNLPSKLDTHNAAKIMTSGFDGQVFTDVKVFSYSAKADFDDLNLCHWESNPDSFWMANVAGPTVLPVH
jgi:hypothetical protein